jgi:dTMP kinase
MKYRRGLYIAFEGGEGSGKSTQAKLLTDRLGSSALSTREPGSTRLGERLRSILLDPATGEISAYAEVLLMAAARAQHMEEIIAPALSSGGHVVSDRTFASSIAYQGAGRRVGAEAVLDINLSNPNLVAPDIMFILAPPNPGELARRMDRDLDRFERAGEDFHQRVADCFGNMAAILSTRPKTAGIKVLAIESDSGTKNRPAKDIHQEIYGQLGEHCEQMGIEL